MLIHLFRLMKSRYKVINSKIKFIFKTFKQLFYFINLVIQDSLNFKNIITLIHQTLINFLHVTKIIVKKVVHTCID